MILEMERTDYKMFVWNRITFLGGWREGRVKIIFFFNFLAYMTQWMTTSSAELKNAEKWFEKGIGGDGGFLVAKIKLLVLYGLRSLLASSVYGILQERILEWVAMLFSRVFSQSRDWIHVWLLPWQEVSFATGVTLEAQLCQVGGYKYGSRIWKQGWS